MFLSCSAVRLALYSAHRSGWSFFCRVDMRCVFSEYLEVEPGIAASQRSGVTRWLRLLTALRDDLTTTVFPDDCHLCAGSLTSWSKTPVCDACLGRVSPQQDSLCLVCGEALGMESARFAVALGADACTACRLAAPEFARAVAFGRYEDELRELLHQLKYSHMQRLAVEPLGRWLAEAIATLAPQAGRDVAVIAVPLYSARERARGFNQSVLLANAAIRHLRKTDRTWKLQSAHDALRRTRDTEAQFSLQPRARRSNMRGAFAVAQGAGLRGREVLLVDDIMTTGATARECARVLRRAGAANVWVATVARAQPETAILMEPGDVARWGGS